MKKQPRKRSKREIKLFENLLRVTYEFIKGKHYNPLTRTSLVERLRIHPDHLAIFDQVLKSLHEEGKVNMREKKYHPELELAATEKLVRGTLRVHPRGFGFVELDDAGEADIFIPKPYMADALDGDSVEVIIDTSAISPKGPEGKIYAVCERARKTLVGTVIEISGGKISVYSQLLGPDAICFVEAGSESVKRGDRLLLNVIEWGTKKKPTRTTILQRLGNISDPAADIRVALYEYDIRQDFPEEALAEAKGAGSRVLPKEIEGRLDLREQECMTIDPDTAKDYDDALSVERKGDGYKLFVHIADVAHYVKAGGALDREARLRCNSTYFPNFCMPMLPHELSSNLCSLKEGVARLTITVILDIDKTGSVTNIDIARSVIKSSKRFTYKIAKAVIDGTHPSIHQDMLLLMTELARILKARRRERGSIELNMPEMAIIVDEKGVPQGTELIPYDITHQMVEEFMLLANEAVAKHLSELGKELTFRVHEEPDPESIREFAALAEAFGYKIAPEPTPAQIQEFFSQIEGSPCVQYLSTCYIRSMRLASYSADNIGHYGLSLEHYCHFTSPIRRYVDLIAERLLFEETYDRKELDAICKRASERERISAKAESSLLTLKKLRLCQRYMNDEPGREFEATITRIKPFGLFFDIVDLALEGFLHISELENDYFIFDEERRLLIGEHNGSSYRAADSITVRVREINLVMQSIRFELVRHARRKIQRRHG
jgi:ribonuclease R